MNQAHHNNIEKPKTHWKKIVFQVSVSILIIALLFKSISIPEILSSMKRVSLIEWCLYLFIGLFIHILGIAKWRLQLKAVHVSLGFLDATRYYAAGMFANVFMPSLIGGDILRSGLVIRQLGRKRDVVFSGLADRLCDVMALCILAVFGCFFVSNVLNTQGYTILLVVIIGLVIAITSAIVVLYLRPPIWLPKPLSRQTNRLRVTLWRLIYNYKMALSALLLSLGLQVCVVLLSIALGKAVGIELSSILWFFVWPLAKLTAMAPISFGGIGVQEMTLVGLMTSLDVPPALALAQGILWRGMIIANGFNSCIIWLVLNRICSGSFTRLYHNNDNN